MLEPAERLQARLRTLFVLLLLVGAAFVVWSSGDFRRAASLFPFYAGWAAILLCAAELARQFIRRKLLTRGEEGPATADIGVEAEENTVAGMLRGLLVFGWIFAYGALILFLGMPAATMVFVPLLLHLRFRSDWRATVGIVAGLLALMALLRFTLGLRWPQGMLGLPF